MKTGTLVTLALGSFAAAAADEVLYSSRYSSRFSKRGQLPDGNYNMCTYGATICIHSIFPVDRVERLD